MKQEPVAEIVVHDEGERMGASWTMLKAGYELPAGQYALYTNPAPSVNQRPIGDVTEAVTRTVIEVEKLLCEKLGSKWAPSGMSIQALVDELAERPTIREALAQPQQEPVAWWHQKSDTFTSGSLVSNFMEWVPLYTSPPVSGTYTTGVMAERQRIVNLLMIQHEAAKEAHNYWHVAAQLIQADVASDT